jgi:hypothetical protein
VSAELGADASLVIITGNAGAPAGNAAVVSRDGSRLAFEHQGRHVAGVFETVDCPDVRMIDRCEQSCFAFEARHAIGVRRERRQQDLQRDVAPRLDIACAIHFAHPAGPEQRDELVDADPGSRRESHAVGFILVGLRCCHRLLST